jgi:ABC-2 type transport system ATP-binding protein
MASEVWSVEVVDLHKFYGEVHALRGATFSLRPGEIVGLLGPNGAGKSTTMKVLTGVLSASSGAARVAGIDVVTDSIGVRRKLGYLPENVPLYGNMLVYDYLVHMARVRGVPSATLDTRVASVIHDCGLRPVAGKRVDELSKGYQQRVGLAQAIVHDPEVLILDEPTTGLDPNQIVEIRNLIRAIGARKTVLLSSHILQEIEALCDRVIVVASGRVVADGIVSDLMVANQCADIEALFRKLTVSPAEHSPAGATESAAIPR